MDNNKKNENQCYQFGYNAGDRSCNFVKDEQEAGEAIACAFLGGGKDYQKGYEDAYRDTNPFAQIAPKKK